MKFHLFGKGEVDSSYDSFLTVDWWFQEVDFLQVLVLADLAECRFANVEKQVHSVDGSEIQQSPVEVSSLSHYLQGFI